MTLLAPPPATPAPVQLLTPRERQVVREIVCLRKSTKEAARALGISYRSVEVYRMNIYKKLGARNVVDLIYRLGWLRGT